MKKILLVLLPAALMFGCSDNKSTSETVSGDSLTTNKMDDDDDDDKDDVTMPYVLPRKPDWKRGPNSNAAVAMNTLRAYETNDMSAMQQYLADTVEFHVDNYSFKGSRDSTVAMFTKHRAGVDSVSIKMHDFESVKSKSRNEQWVSLWYTEVSKMKGGKLDSAMVMDDIKIVNGKVALIDSKMRRLVAKKS